MTELEKALDVALADAEDMLEGLDTELREVIRVAYNHGAYDYVKLNYPAEFKEHRKQSDKSKLEELRAALDAAYAVAKAADSATYVAAKAAYYVVYVAYYKELEKQND